ncbi:MAG: helix-turn-helix domain-containing protein [Erythrobacter sp.]|nr:helix-turn-helix domain-containing protein [Erythrobacter sp.]
MGQGKSNGAGELPEAVVHSEFHPPPSQFDGCFTTLYHLTLETEDGATVRDYLQPEWAGIRFFGGGMPDARIGDTHVNGVRFTATGPSSLPCQFELGASRMWGVGLLPLGWARFIDADARDLANVVCDGANHPAFAKFDCLSDVLCDPSADKDAQFEAFVQDLTRLMRPNRDEPKIMRVHEAMVDVSYTAVGDLADACGMSIRTLERVCRRYFGFTPKLLMRRQRFMRSLTSFMLHRGTRWTEAMDGHYHDQAQFTREFHEFMTMNPSEYAALDHPILSSFMEARARIWGSAAQTLDKPSR